MDRQTSTRWLAVTAGALVLAYSVAVLAFVATMPDLRLRCLTVDADKQTDGVSRGVVVRGTPGIRADGEVPRPGDVLIRIGPQNGRVRTFVDFTSQLIRLRGVALPPGGGPLEPGTELSDLWDFLPWMVEDADGQRWVKVEFIRQADGRRAAGWLQVQSLPLGQVLLSFVWFSLQLGIFGFGALALWNRPYDRAARLFFAMCVVVVAAFVGGYHWWVVAGNLWLNVPFTICAMLAPAVSLHFFLVYPRPRGLLIRRPAAAISALYAVPVGCIAVVLALIGRISAVHGAESGAEATGEIVAALRILRTVVYAYFAVSACYFAAMLLAIWHSYRLAEGPTERGQMSWVWRGGQVSAVFVLIALLLAIFDRESFALGAGRVPMLLASLSFMLAYSVAIVRYKLMLADQIVSKVTIHYLAGFALTAAFCLLVALGLVLPRLLNISLSQQQVFTVAIVLMLAVMLLLWVRDWIQQSIDRRFFREKYQLDRTLQRLNRAAGRLGDPERLAEMMLASCREVLGVRRAAFYVQSSDGSFQLAAALSLEDMPTQFLPDPPLVEALRESGSLQRVSPGSRAAMSPVQQRLRELDAHLLHPLEVDGEIAALVVMGEKESRTPFTAEDLTFLNAVGQITNVALHSARIEQNVRRLNDELRLKTRSIENQKRQIALLQSELAPGPAGAAFVREEATEFRREAIKGNSPAIRRVLETVRKVAGSESSVLIRGESGTGKELLAQVLHDNSPRSAGPMVRVHCAALSPSLLESELFGHTKGAFTGAHRDKIGRFELATGGTLFLDEIGDISLETQVKLLRVIQERCFEPVGSTRTVSVDVRLITATHQDLEKLIRDGRFREDLYYRLNVISLTLPPLRERRPDILELALFFLNRSAGRSGKRVRHFDDEALAALEAHDWPGNVRELQNVVERAVVLADGETISLNELPPELVQGPAERRAEQAVIGGDGEDSGARLRSPHSRTTARREGTGGEMGTAVARPADLSEASERDWLEDALRRCEGNKARAARLLGLPRSTYYSKLKKFEIA